MSGTCNEHVDIDRDRISLVGKQGAKLSAPPGLSSVISIRGRLVQVKDFEIDADGVWNGILVRGGGYAMISGNEIRNAGDGIMLRDGSTAEIYDNDIRETDYMGISHNVGASADIAVNTIEDSGAVGIFFRDGSKATVTGNTIKNSGGSGIWVGGNSTASVSSNIISGNTHSGVGVVESGSAQISGNTITNNELFGVSVERNSSIVMPDWEGGANLIEGNGLYGILCGASGSMIGIVQNFGSGNNLGDLYTQSGCDKAGF